MQFPSFSLYNITPPAPLLPEENHVKKYGRDQFLTNLDPAPILRINPKPTDIKVFLVSDNFRDRECLWAAAAEKIVISFYVFP